MATEYATEEERDYFIRTSEYLALKKSENRNFELNQYNPNNSLTDLAILLKDILQESRNSQDTARAQNQYSTMASANYPDIVSRMSTSIEKNSGMPAQIAMNRIIAYEGMMTHLPGGSRVDNPIESKITLKLQQISEKSPELVARINKLPQKIKTFLMSMLLAQYDSEQWLKAEKNENTKVTTSKFLVDLSNELPRMPVDQLKRLYPESFPEDRPDEISRDTLLYNMAVFKKPWYKMNELSKYVLGVEQGQIYYDPFTTNAIANIIGEGMLYAANLFPEYDDKLEIMNSQLEEVNSRQSDFDYCVGSFTKDYFLDVAFLSRSFLTGTLKKGAKYAMATRKLVKNSSKMTHLERGLRRQGRSLDEIARITQKEAARLLLVYVVSKLAGVAGGKSLAQLGLSDTGASIGKNTTSFIGKSITNETTK